MHWDMNIVEFYAYQTLLKIAQSMTNLFVPIYLFSDLGYSLPQVVLFFVVLQLGFSLIIPFAGYVIHFLGIKKTIAASLPMLVIYFMSLKYLTGDFVSDMLFMTPILFLRAGLKGSGQVATDVFMAKHVLKKNTAKMLAMLKILMVTASILAPLIGGWVSYIYGFDMLFWIAIGLVLASGIPLFLTPDEHFPPKYEAHDILDFVKDEADRNYLVAEFGNIFTDVIMWIMWPLFLFFAIQSTAGMGTLVTISATLSMGMAYFIGQKINGKDAKLLMKNGIRGAATLFFFRAISLNPFIIGIIDAANKILDPIYRIPYDRAAYRVIIAHKNQIKMANIKQFISENYYTFSTFILLMVTLIVPEQSTNFFIGLFAFSAIIMLIMQRMACIKLTPLDQKIITEQEHHHLAEEELKVMEEGELR